MITGLASRSGSRIAACAASGRHLLRVRSRAPATADAAQIPARRTRPAGGGGNLQSRASGETSNSWQARLVEGSLHHHRPCRLREMDCGRVTFMGSLRSRPRQNVRDASRKQRADSGGAGVDRRESGTRALAADAHIARAGACNRSLAAWRSGRAPRGSRRYPVRRLVVHAGSAKQPRGAGAPAECSTSATGPLITRPAYITPRRSASPPPHPRCVVTKMVPHPSYMLRRRRRDQHLDLHSSRPVPRSVRPPAAVRGPQHSAISAIIARCRSSTRQLCVDRHRCWRAADGSSPSPLARWRGRGPAARVPPPFVPADRSRHQGAGRSDGT